MTMVQLSKEIGVGKSTVQEWVGLEKQEWQIAFLWSVSIWTMFFRMENSGETSFLLALSVDFLLKGYKEEISDS